MSDTALVTRIAPSPTGDMHIGTARTAYFNWLLAKASGGRFILRIDDTDVERNKEEHVDVILNTIKWLGLTADNMFKQSEQTNQYESAIAGLDRAGYLVKLDNGALALRWTDAMPKEWVDEICGPVRITQTNIDQIDGRVILCRGGDKLGQFTYQFATVVDDYVSGVNYICRGTDHISNTAKQVAIWSALATVDPVEPRPLPKFAHIGLIFKDGKKMSKRDGAASMLYYRDANYHPEALLNYMLRLGWAPRGGDDRKYNIIPRSLAVDIFLTEGTMKNSISSFDANKLEWYNKKYKATA